MKKVYSILLVTLFLSTLTVSTNVVGQTHNVQLNQANTTDQCDTPDASFTINAVQSIKFDTNKINVARGSCLALTFNNNDDILHDFKIDAGDGFEAVLLAIDAGASATVNIKIPDADVTVTFYCGVPGHFDTMNGDLIVGEGSDEEDTPGFGLLLAFVGLFAFAAVMRTIRK